MCVCVLCVFVIPLCVCVMGGDVLLLSRHRATRSCVCVCARAHLCVYMYVSLGCVTVIVKAQDCELPYMRVCAYLCVPMCMYDEEMLLLLSGHRATSSLACVCIYIFVCLSLCV
jgi:hypothetical protein